MLQTKNSTIRYPSISAELLEMERVDQAMRNEPNADPTRWPEVDRRHTSRLKEIVTEIGWPTRSKG
jgi:hypothetical protein